MNTLNPLALRNCPSGVSGLEKVAYILHVNHTDLGGRQVDVESLLPVWHQLTVGDTACIKVTSNAFADFSSSSNV